MRFRRRKNRKNPPLRPNQSYGAGIPPDVLDLTCGDLSDYGPVGKYLANLESIQSRLTMERCLAATLCVMGEGKMLKNVGLQTSRRYHSEIWRFRWEKIDHQFISKFHVRMRDSGYGLAKRKMTPSAIKGVLKYCVMSDLMKAETYHKLILGFPRIKGKSAAAGRYVPMDEVTALLSACDRDPNRVKGMRDAAIICIGWSCGPRADEMISLKVRNYSRVSGTLLLDGKGGKKVHIPIVGFAKERLDAWLDARGSAPGPIFTRVFLGGNVYIRDRLSGEQRFKPLTRPDRMTRIMHLRRRQAGIEERVTFHDLRRTAATEIAKRYGIKHAKELLRHASIETTQRYIKLDQSELRDAMEDRDTQIRDAMKLVNGGGPK